MDTSPKRGPAMADGSFAIRNAQDLRGAIELASEAPNRAALMAHAIGRAKALQLTGNLPKGWTTEKAYADIATLTGIECPGCPSRKFFSDEAFVEHAEKVHTFDDIRCLVGDELREQYEKPGNPLSNPPVSSTWVWIQDMTDDWVVYQVDGGSSDAQGLYKADYTIDDNDKVTLGDSVSVVRRTVYDTVKEDD